MTINLQNILFTKSGDEMIATYPTPFGDATFRGKGYKPDEFARLAAVKIGQAIALYAPSRQAENGNAQ